MNRPVTVVSVHGNKPPAVTLLSDTRKGRKQRQKGKVTNTKHYCFYLPHLKVKLNAEGGKNQKNNHDQEMKQTYLWYNGFLLLRNQYLLYKGLSVHRACFVAQFKMANVYFLSFLIYSSVATTTSDNQAKEGAALSQPIRCTLWPRTRHQSSFPAWSKPSPPDNAIWLGRERWSVGPTATSIIFFQSRNTESHCLDQRYSYVTLCKGRHLRVQKINNKHSNHIFLFIIPN